VSETEHGLLFAGFAAGTFLTGLSLSALSVNPLVVYVPPGDMATVIAGVGGAMLGAVVGGVIQWTISTREYEKHRRDAAEAATLTEKAEALGTVVRALTITNQLFDIMSSIAEMFDAIKKFDGHEEMVLWQRILPLSGLPLVSTRFEICDVGLMFKAGGDDLANMMLLVSERYHSLLDAIRTYGQRRAAIAELMPATMDGGLGTTLLTKQEAAVLAPRFQELKDLSEQICTTLPEDLQLSIGVTESIGPLLSKYFGVEKFHNAAVPADVSERIKGFRAMVADLMKVKGYGFRTANVVTDNAMSPALDKYVAAYFKEE
jgi:hypothetical protein